MFERQAGELLQAADEMADFICAEIDQRSGSGCPFLPLAVTAAAALSLTRIAARQASASRETLPRLFRYGCRQRGGGVLARLVIERRPQLLVTADGEYERALLLLEITPQPTIRAIDFIAENPGERHASND